MNTAENINPAEQVERIREILIGRDMHLVNERIQQLEAKMQNKASELTEEISEQLRKSEEQSKAAQEHIRSVSAHIRQQLQQETLTRGKQVNELAQKIDAATARLNQTSQQLLSTETNRNELLSKQIEQLSSEMAARIDAHSRQVMEHMHREIQQWKTRMDEQIAALSETKVDRQELTSRLARIASAAMEDTIPPATPIPPSTGGSPNLSSLDTFAIPVDDFTS